MKIIKIFFLFLTLFTYSCSINKNIVTTDLNTTGTVVKIKSCVDCQDGNFIYTLKLNPDEKIKIISNHKYQIGDSIFVKSIIK